MNITALLISAALAFFTGAQDAAPKLAELAKSDAFAVKAVQDAEPQSELQSEPRSEPQSGPDAGPRDDAVVDTAVASGADPAADPAADPVVDSGAADPAQAQAPSGAEPLPAPAEVAEATVAAQSERGAERAAAWFDGVETLSARFVQTAPDGTVSEGALSLQRPGRARFDYDDPSPLLLVADGATVAIADFQLETIDRAPIASTPMRFLLTGADQLAEAVVEAGRSGDRLYVTVVDPAREVDGRLTLVFDDPSPEAAADTMMLAGWFAVDALGGLTEINLTDTARGVSFDPRLFILDDEDVVPDDRRSRRR